MAVFRDTSERIATGRPLDLARVLVVDDHLASRLTLQTLLAAGGYAVDVAASAAEAFAKLDDQQYELVLSHAQIETSQTGGGILPYARSKEYRPATALITAYHEPRTRWPHDTDEQRVSVDTQDVSTLLGKVADLIGIRASRRSERALRQSAVY